MSKLRREELETTAAQRAAKKLRQEMKQRGHVGLPKRGENPAADAHEKMLHKIATRYELINCNSQSLLNELGTTCNAFRGRLRYMQESQLTPSISPILSKVMKGFQMTQ